MARLPLANTVALLVLGATSAHAATFHVSPQPLSSVPAATQFRTIHEAAERVQAGDLVILHGGIYRETVNIKNSGTPAQPIRFQAANGERVVVTGADRLEKWDKVSDTGNENIFSTDWTHHFINWSPTMAHPYDDYHLLIGRGEQVTINNYPLRQVLKREQLARGTFFADIENKKLWVQASNNSAEIGKTPPWAPHVEAATREIVWDCAGAWVELRGVQFSMCANSAQNGMARFSGRFDRVEDCVFENSNGTGAQFNGQDLTIARCTFADNGQMGWRAEKAHRLHMIECLTARNNLKNFARGWEAGGNKIVLTRDALIEKSRFVANRGIGLWFDIGNENCTVANCLIADNEDAGIFYEISYGLKAHDNVMIGNGFTDDAYGWGASGGIAVSSSPNCVVERNLFLGNKEGFQFREAKRTTPRIDALEGAPEEPVWNHDETIRNNTFAFNRDAGVWAWFDLDDERLWPRAMQEKPAEREFSLEKLKLNFSNNFYAPHEGATLFNWGPQWKRNRKYDELGTLQNELKMEQGSVVAPLKIADYLTRDLRVPANSPALKMRCYPQGEVPGVRLGILK